MLDLRLRLCILIALAGVPALGIQIYNEWQFASAREAEVRAEALRIAQLQSVEEAAKIEGAKQFLLALAQTPAIRRAEADCGTLLADSVRRFGQFDMLGVTDTAGRLICNSAGATSGSLSVSELPFFADAARGASFVVGDYAVGRLTGAKVLHIAYPLHDEAGGFEGVLYGGLRLDRFAESLADRPLPLGGSLLITDRNGTVLYRMPDGEHWIGQSARQHVGSLLPAAAPGVNEVAGLDGVRRLFAFVPLAASKSGLFFSVGLREDLAFADVRRANRDAVLLTVLGTLLSAFVAWFGSDALVRRPARALIEAAARWRLGDYRARVAAQGGGPEFRRIAEEMDRLVEAVAARESELRRLNLTLETGVAERTRELAATEARYRTYFEHSAEGLFVIDVLPDGRLVYDGVNPAHESATGLRNEEIRGRTAEEALPASTAAKVAANYQRCINAGEPIRYEETLELPRGQRYCETLLAPVKDENGRVNKILGCTRDVTEQRRTEAQLRQAQRMEAVGQLTGGIAHDFNNLLTAIIGNLERIKARAARDGHMLAMAESALRASERGAQLTSQLLSFARRQTLRPEPVSIGALIAETSALMRRAVGETIKINIVIDADLWPCCLDAAQFEAAILNLVLNARDAMPSGGNLRIAAQNVCLSSEDAARAELSVPGEYVRVSVADDGMGMDEATQGRVFEPFFTTKETGKGTGLGLPMVQGFAAQSGGAISIDSAPGHGTTVSLLLPRVEAPASAVETTSGTMDRTAPAVLAGKTVLVVEDEEPVLEIACSTLEEAGCRVYVARDGHEAVALLAGDGLRARIDLLFSDVVLPNGVDGVTVAREARRLRPEINVLLTSGYAEDVLARRGPRMDRMLAKPYRPKDLLREAAMLLSVHRPRLVATGTER